MLRITRIYPYTTYVYERDDHAIFPYTTHILENRNDHAISDATPDPAEVFHIDCVPASTQYAVDCKFNSNQADESYINQISVIVITGRLHVSVTASNDC